ncbi:hypothetical protein BDQ17DRAFT_1425888 [Cyathus striatus]|nr:hypothetical protein BDQ17DRAFT_1425888 [Cyathus striatus]
MLRFLDLTEKSSKIREDSNGAKAYATPNQYYSVIDTSKPDLTGVAEQVPDSYLISPLAQFTGRISAFEGTNLPDVSEEDEDAMPPMATPGPGRLTDGPSCGALGHPYSCHCEPISMFSPAPQEIRYTTGREPPSRQTSFMGAPPTFSSVAGSRQYSPEADQYGTIPETVVQYSTTPEATYDVPYATPRSREFVVERSRSRSRSNRDRSRPVSRGTGSRSRNSGSPTRAPSPSRPVSYLTQSRTSSARDVNTPPVYPTPPNSGREGGDVMRQRLLDVLDSPLPASSLPSLSGSHFPSSYRERTPMQDDPEASRPPSRGTARRTNSENVTQNLTHSSSSSAAPVPTPTPTPVAQPSGRSTTASQAAAVIEERQRQERRERRKAEKERERALQLERERTSGDVQRSRNASNDEVPLQPREPINVYGNPNSSSNTTSHGRHTSTSASYGGWSGSGASSSLREGSTVHTAYQSRKGPSPVPMSTTQAPGIYV